MTRVSDPFNRWVLLASCAAFRCRHERGEFAHNLIEDLRQKGHERMLED